MARCLPKPSRSSRWRANSLVGSYSSACRNSAVATTSFLACIALLPRVQGLHHQLLAGKLTGGNVLHAARIQLRGLLKLLKRSFGFAGGFQFYPCLELPSWLRQQPGDSAAKAQSASAGVVLGRGCRIECAGRWSGLRPEFAGILLPTAVSSERKRIPTTIRMRDQILCHRRRCRCRVESGPRESTVLNCSHVRSEDEAVRTQDVVRGPDQGPRSHLPQPVSASS